MPATCGVCNVDISSCKSTEVISCAGNCKKTFHVNCVKEDIEEKKVRTAKQWRCRECREGSISSGSSTPITKEFMLKVLESFKKELFTELKNVKKEVSEMSQSLSFLSEKVDESTKLMENLRSELQVVKKENEVLRETVTDLQDRTRSLEQYTRRSNIEISGIPVTPREDVIQLVKDVGAVIGLEVEESQINAAHRVPSFRKDRVPSLVVQFTGRSTRDTWLKQFRELKESVTVDQVNTSFPKAKLYINEHLSPANKVFLSDLKKKCAGVGIKYAWCREGKFFIRKADGDKCRRIYSEADIKKLK